MDIQGIMDLKKSLMIIGEKNKNVKVFIDKT